MCSGIVIVIGMASVCVVGIVGAGVVDVVYCYWFRYRVLLL